MLPNVQRQNRRFLSSHDGLEHCVAATRWAAGAAAFWLRSEESHATSDYFFALEVLPLLSRDHQIAWL